MRRELVRSAIVTLCAVVFVSFLPLAALAQSAKPISWGYSPGSPPTKGSSYDSFTWGPLAEKIAADTQGRLKLTVHEGLVPDNRVIEGVRDGTVDMGTQVVFYRAELAPLNFVALPIIPLDKQPEIVKQMRSSFTRFLSEKSDVMLLGYGHWAGMRLITKTPVRTLDEFKGYKVRTGNPETLGLMKSAGASPVFLPMSEVYTAFQRGVINGGITSLEGAVGNKWCEQAKYVNNWPLGGGSYIWVANKKSWGALPADLRNQILKLFQDKYEVGTVQGSVEDDKNLKARLESTGVTFVQPDPKEVEKYLSYMPPILAQWKARIDPSIADELMGVINKVVGSQY
jgi:TRAP-type transport system periplasmic protein